MAKPNQYSLWMGDLEMWMDEEFIKEAFRSMGETVKGVKIIRQRHSGLPAGYCFVEFNDEEEARRAMLRLNGKIVPGSDPPTRFKLNQASFGREHLKDQEHSLFIGELSEDVDDFALYSAFHKKYNSVKAAKVVLDSEGRSRGFGFVRFSDEEEQKLALVEMNHYTGLGQKPIRVSTATAKRGGGNMYNYSAAGMPQSYYPPYQNYGTQSYYNQPWWQLYQMPSSYYNYGADYSQTGQSQTQTGNEDEELEDPELDVDVEKVNAEFMEQNEEVFISIEGSRWHPIDNAMATVDDIVVK